MKKEKITLTILALLIISIAAYAISVPKLFKFDKKNALKEWQEKVFKNKVLYVVEPDKDGGRLDAKSKNACSGLFYKIRFDPKRYPLISWKWKVAKFPDKNTSKPKTTDGWLEKDDYAARVYVIFPSWIFSNIKTIEYVWSLDAKEGTIMTSPYFKNIKLIVVTSGKKDKPDEWVNEKRNIYEDYKKAFGKAPSSVGAIALMTDTDNTASTAEAFYADIKVGYKND